MSLGHKVVHENGLRGGEEVSTETVHIDHFDAIYKVFFELLPIIFSYRKQIECFRNSFVDSKDCMPLFSWTFFNFFHQRWSKNTMFVCI